ncbi:MAG TPA: hypothetical protein DEF59_01195, partial [Candidatus Magasanikbacteria bacterium]|nr:hypothetical protein [Candidatus Magasanikbacteria bacterium]
MNKASKGLKSFLGRTAFSTFLSLLLFLVIVQPSRAGFFSELGSNITGSLSQIGQYVADGMDVVSNSVVSLGKKVSNLVSPTTENLATQESAQNIPKITIPEPTENAAPQFKAVTAPPVQNVQPPVSTAPSPLLKTQTTASVKTVKNPVISKPASEVVIYTNKSTIKQAEVLKSTSSGSSSASLPTTLS